MFHLSSVSEMFDYIFPVVCIATVFSGIKAFFCYKIVKLLTEISGKLSKGNNQS